MTRIPRLTAQGQRQRLVVILVLFLALVLLLLALAAIQASEATPEEQADPRPRPTASFSPLPSAEPSDPADPSTPDAVAVLAELDTVPVAAHRADGYDRDDFGSAWADVDDNGCDTRNDILRRDLTEAVFKSGSSCVIVSGELDDPYTATVIAFVRGPGTSDDVQIDHIVPLSWAWGYGAADWTDGQRRAFANDPSNLRAVEGHANMSKGDSGPGEWLPDNTAFRCAYVASFVDVVVEYRLAIPAADRTAIRSVLADC